LFKRLRCDEKRHIAVLTANGRAGKKEIIGMPIC